MMFAARSDDSIYVRLFQAGDTVRRHDDDEKCVVVSILGDWLWLNAADCRAVSPFTGHACDYYVVKSPERLQWYQ